MYRHIKEKHDQISEVIDTGKIVIDSWDKANTVCDFCSFEVEPEGKIDLFLNYCLQGVIKDGVRKTAVMMVASIATAVVISSDLHWIYKTCAVFVGIPMYAKYLVAKFEKEMAG